ncbi:hypothetical protein [Clostridium thermarum]|uniref:hypothetical protein n=1 Tax=Clostridium thermarum TaxID=1716543 RepID=UPI00111D403A|nr:hypothetical protein [Clostridium thermarum]
MSNLPLKDYKPESSDYLQGTIKNLELLINKENRNSMYFEKLLDQISDLNISGTIKNIVSISKEHCNTLKAIYMELTSKSYSCSQGDVHIDGSIKKALMWALLDTFEIVKIYHSLLENLTAPKHRAFVLKMINDEVTAVTELNALLVEK